MFTHLRHIGLFTYIDTRCPEMRIVSVTVKFADYGKSGFIVACIAVCVPGSVVCQLAA